jgi:hypothetical protein
MSPLVTIIAALVISVTTIIMLTRYFISILFFLFL